METNAFKDLGLKEMNNIELKDTNGGKIGWLILGALASELLFEGAAKCWADFKEGFYSVQ
jgi:hypothetical protein